MKRASWIFSFIWLHLSAPLAMVASAQEWPVSRSEFDAARVRLIETKRKIFERHALLKSSGRLAQQNKYDVKYYALDLRLDPVLEQVSGVVELRAVSRAGNLDRVLLDLYSNLQVDSVGAEATDFVHEGDRLDVQLIEARQQGEEFTVRVAYHGTPRRSGFGSFGFDFHAGIPIIWSLSEPYFARSWWPCKDTPNDKADSADIRLTVPETLLAVSNGRLVSDVKNGDGTRTFHWHEGYPITTYLISVAVTNYARFSQWFRYAATDSMEITYYVYPENLAQAEQRLTQTVSMLSYFHQIFGPYPFLSEKYGIAQFPWPGGMEHQTISSQGGFGVTLTVHELAHQWWGDKITNATWHDIWLNEGFASYAEALYFEHVRDKAFYHTYMSWMDHHFPYAIYVDDTTSVSRIFHNTVYDKGAWTLHMLRHVVGDSTFFEILLAYSKDPRFAYGNATTAGFQSVCEAVSGMDLDWFFQPWIYKKGRPVYRARWRAEEVANGWSLTLRIEQVQFPKNALFPMPIDVTIKTGSGDTVVTVFNDAAVQDFEFLVRDLPKEVFLDKDGWILKSLESVTHVQEPSHLPEVFTLHQNFPNPFNANTVIEFELPEQSLVELTIYSTRGRQVRQLVSRAYAPGSYRAVWDGRDDDGRSVASGVYFYRIVAGTFRRERKLLLLR